MGKGPKELTEAEKLTYNFFLAVTILHELSHAYGQIYFGTCHAMFITDPDTQNLEMILKPEVIYKRIYSYHSF